MSVAMTVTNAGTVESMNKDIIMGIDPSMRSTGVCVWDRSTNEHKYILICSSTTKKVRAFAHPAFQLFEYQPIGVKECKTFK